MEERNPALKNTINLIIAQIHNGVIDEKTKQKREFDIFDYYTLTSMSLKEFMQAAGTFGIEPIGIKGFFLQNDLRNISHDDTDRIMKMGYIVNGIEATLEQKKLMMN